MPAAELCLNLILAYLGLSVPSSGRPFCDMSQKNVLSSIQ